MLLFEFFNIKNTHNSSIVIDWLAEWSKALVLGTSLFGGVGSNPTPVTILVQLTTTSVVSSVVRIPAFQAGGPGSIPGRRTILTFWHRPEVCWHRAPKPQRSGGLAQSVECALCKREAPGSKPGFSTFCLPYDLPS